MHSHTSGLVDGDDVVVFVENIERNGFGFGAEWRTRLDLDLDALACAQAVRTFRGLRIDEHQPGFDQLLDSGASQFGVHHDKAVEPGSGVGRSGNKFA